MSGTAATICCEQDGVVQGLRFLERVIYDAAGTDTFTQANYPGLQAVDVQCQAGGSGAGGAGNHTDLQHGTAGSGGAGGNYARSVLTAPQLGATETVTVGAGGAGGPGQAVATPGGESSFGALVVASAGGANSEGLPTPVSTLPRAVYGGRPNETGSLGDLIVLGGAGAPAHTHGNGGPAIGGTGGSSGLGTGGHAYATTTATDGFDGGPGRGYGGGGGGAAATALGLNTDPLDGGAGSDGVVIVDVYV